MKEIQFLRLPSQGNIYSMTRLENVTLLGSGSHGRVLAYLKENSSLEEIVLSSIPGSGVTQFTRKNLT
jgi:hypothetical protein